MRFLVASTLASLTLALSACSSAPSSDDTNRGVGGQVAGTGAITGAGGDAGVGGASGSGASASTGGAVGTGATTGSGGNTVNGPLSMGYILDLPGGTNDIDRIDYTAADYVIHAFYTADGAGNVVAASGSSTDDYRNAGLVTKVHTAGRRIVMSLGGANHS